MSSIKVPNKSNISKVLVILIVFGPDYVRRLARDFTGSRYRGGAERTIVRHHRD